MKIGNKTRAAYLFLALTFLSASGCALTGRKTLKPIYPDHETATVMAGLTNTNPDLTTFKGTGGVKIEKKDQFFRYRLAWAGASPNKLYMMILLSGKPVETIITNGDKIRLQSHTGAHQTITVNTSDPDLDKLLSIPVKIKDIIALITGRIPVHKHSGANLKAVPGGYSLNLKNNRNRIIQKISFNRNRVPTGYEVFTSGRKLIYKAETGMLSNMDGYQIPRKITVTDKKGSLCEISVDRYFSNAPLIPDLFSITP